MLHSPKAGASKELQLRSLRALTRRVSSPAWIRPVLAGVVGGLLSGTVVWALLPPGGVPAIGSLLYDYQILVTGLAAIAAAVITATFTYRSALKQIASERENEKRGQQRRSYALCLELLTNLVAVHARLSRRLATAELLIQKKRNREAWIETKREIEELLAANYDYNWRELSDLNPRISQYLHLFNYSLREFEAQARIHSSKSIGQLQKEDLTGALDLLKIVFGRATRLKWFLSKELDRLSAELGLEEDAALLDQAVIDMLQAEMEAEADREHTSTQAT